MLEYLPLVLTGLLVVALACVPLSERLDRLVTWTAIGVFGSYARSRAIANRQQARVLRSAHVPRPYVAYAARTFLFSAVAGVIGSVLGLYLVAAVLVLVETGVLPVTAFASITEMGALPLFGAVLLGSVTLGVIAAFATYQFRWTLPRYRAGERARQIDSTLERNIAFMFALSRSGMAFTEILRILAKNHAVYGEAAREVGVTVRDVDLFGADLISALRRTAQRTPSNDFQEFIENLTSVLQSGQSVSGFLHEEYEQYKEESESEQERFLELLSTLAEAYVTVFVAGPLFLITILVVIGLVLGGTLTFLRVFTYLVIPLATLGLIVYLDSITSDTDFDRERILESGEDYERVVESHTPEADGVSADGGTTGDLANRARLRIHDRVQPTRYALTHPVETLVEQPVWLLAITCPIAVLYVFGRWILALLATDTAPADLLQPATLESLLGVLDDPVVQAVLFVVGSFAFIWEIRKRQIDALERAIPDFLDRLASTNEAGMPIVASLERVARSDLGGLNREVGRTWTDVQWGAPVEAALQRFEDRVRTPTITRIVTLTTNAMNATSDLGPVLRIAADEAKSTQRLKRERRNELITYLVVIYLAFFVFLAIIVALDTIFVPAIPTAEQFGGGGAAAGSAVSGIGQITAAEKDAYSLLFFHTALVQSVCSGFVAGQMAESDPRSGAKHAFVMLAIAYAIFLVFA
ncbi:type II secretion protein F [Halarchaeum grantii]|uniref:Type II secretion protein F n=1 Tax=Halarchaeum grantii TaxID=1193105 RepID=A0A830F5T6_9EURY|nr:type II secretion system F family protein [Halarchaeum grantii]GGL22379.1 type II secretion protein F [Halarchaeum grantii]